MTKSSATVDENEWTFGQVLPAFLLIGPIATAVKGAFDGQVNSLPPTSTESTTPTGENATNDHSAIIHDAEYLNESIEMRRFRQYLSNGLERNYYDTASCSWIITAFCFMCVQILEATVLIFLELAVQRSSAANALLVMSSLIVIISPTAVYVLILACLLFENLVTDNRKWLIAFSTSASIVLLGLYSLYPVWGILYNPTATRKNILRSSQDITMLGISVSIFGIAYIGNAVVAFVFRYTPFGI